jgi:hypothetical protein
MENSKSRTKTGVKKNIISWLFSRFIHAKTLILCKMGCVWDFLGWPKSVSENPKPQWGLGSWSWTPFGVLRKTRHEYLILNNVDNFQILNSYCRLHREDQILCKIRGHILASSAHLELSNSLSPAPRRGVCLLLEGGCGKNDKFLITALVHGL